MFNEIKDRLISFIALMLYVISVVVFILPAILLCGTDFAVRLNEYIERAISSVLIR